MNASPCSFNLTARRSGGFTLVELVLSLAIMSLLFAGMASVFIISSKALPSATSTTVAQSQTSAALEQLRADLACATAVTQLGRAAITVTVADRGHGAAGEETIRWSWSGTSGAPLTRSYNGSTPATIVSNVTSFALSPAYVAGVLTSAPRVLMVVDNPSSLSLDDNLRITKLTEWGFPYRLIDSSASQADFDTGFAASDVVYCTAGAYSFTLPFRLNNPAIGVVTENETLYITLSFSTLWQTASAVSFTLVNSTHPITLGLVTNDKLVAASNEDLHRTKDTLAPGLLILGSGNGDLVVLDCNATLIDNTSAVARRVALPWGGTSSNPFPFAGLSTDARTILKRSLVWAAAPSLYDSVNIKLKTGSGTEVSTDAELLGHPRVPRP